MTLSLLKVVGVVLLLAVTGVLVILQIKLRNELGDAQDKLKALESKSSALERDVGGSVGGSKDRLEAELFSVKRALAELESKSDESSIALDKSHQEVTALQNKAQKCIAVVNSLKSQVRECESLKTQTSKGKSDVGKVADKPTASKAQEPRSSKTAQFAGDDSNPIPYRGNPGIVIDHKSEDFDALDGNGQDGNNEEDDLNPEEKNDDDVTEEVFNAEQQRRMDLLGDAAEQKDDLNPEEKNDDDVMEEVFNAEQQRRMDLEGNAEQKDDLN